MILKYGAHPHDDNECSVTIARQSWRDASGERRGYTERWTVEGMLLGAGADLVADLTTKIATLKAAYDEDDLDLVLYESDGVTETGHTLKTADTVGGTVVVSGPSFPSGRGAEYATYRKYTLTVEAKVEDTSNDLIAYVESVSTAGTGASRFVIHTPLIGAPQVQVTAERTPVVVVQEGSAVGRASYPSVPAPLSLSAEHQDRRRIVRKNAERQPDGSFRNYEISWHYEFSTPSATLTTIPSFDGTGGGNGGVAAHYHSGADITSSYVREPYIDPLIARVSDVAAYVGTLRLDGLADVNISAVADRDSFQYDSGSSKWINTKNGIVLTGSRTPLVDLNPSSTGSQQVVDITPSAAIGESAHWDGIKMDLAALDPSASGALIHPIHVDATGIDLTNDPEVHGIQVDLPATYTGEADKAAAYFSGGGVVAQFCDIELHAANFSQGQVNIDWNAASAQAGVTQALFDARIRKIGSTGGHFHVFDASVIGTGSVEVTLLGTYDTMDIVHQHTGSWTTADKAWKFNGGFTDVTTAFGSAGTDVQIFTSDNDYIYIGHSSKFSMLQVLLAITSSKNILGGYSYSDGGAGWPSFSPSDQTHGFQESALIIWNSADLAGWATEAVNAETKYWIRIQRTRNVLGTPPTEDTILILEPIVYYWDSSGDLYVHDIVATSLSGTLALSDLADYAQGSLIVGTGADWAAVAKGTAGQIWMSDGTDLGWTTTFTADMLFSGATKQTFRAASQSISSQAVGYMDYEATTEHRFNTGNVQIDNNLDVAGFSAFGPNAVATTNYLVYARDITSDPTSGAWRAFSGYINGNPTLTGTLNMQGLFADVIWAGVLNGNVANLYGASVVARAYADATAAYGFRFAGYVYGASNVTNMYGAWAEVGQTNTSTNVYGIYSYPHISGTVANVRGTHSYVRQNATANITNAYGVYSDTYLYAGATCGTYYGVYVIVRGADDPTTAYAFYGNVQRGTTKWGIYITGETKNYFSGNVGIGDSTPDKELDVNGDINVHSGNAYYVDDVQVLGGQGAVVADVNDQDLAGTDGVNLANLNTYIDELRTQVNALLARCRAHGIIAT